MRLAAGRLCILVLLAGSRVLAGEPATSVVASLPGGAGTRGMSVDASAAEQVELAALPQAVGLRCEYMHSPMGLDTAKPRFSWELLCSKRGTMQSGYRILVASSADKLAKSQGDLWDSGKMESAQSVGVEYRGAKLAAGVRAMWKVQVWDQNGTASPWSEVADFSVGLLAPEDWAACWIGMASAERADCPWMRKTFTLEQIPESALAYVGSIGYHELYINGHKVGDQVLAPSVSNLRKRALYLTYDVRQYLRRGENAVALWVAPGWSGFGHRDPESTFKVAKGALAIAQLQLGPMSGPFTRIVSDESWRCSLSTTRHRGEWRYGDFGGDRVDANKEIARWNDTGLDDSRWGKATVYHPGCILSSDWIEPNRIIRDIPAARVKAIGPKKYRFEMAELFTGWVELKVKGQPGQQVNIGVSSIPGRDDEFNQRNVYIIGASGSGVFCNRFSYHLVGIVTVEGLDVPPVAGDLVGHMVANDRRSIGSFQCSNELLNKIYNITVNNYQNLSTGGMTVDCPHRERLGYGGDGHTSLEIALDAFDSHAFLSKWAQDWRDIQEPGGRIKHTAPTMGGGGGPAWSGFAITLPWEVYKNYGDTRILEATYPVARKWLSYMDEHIGADGLLQPLPGGKWMFLGDWLAPGGRKEAFDSTEALFFNNCYLVYAIKMTAKIARVIGKPDDAVALEKRAEVLVNAINRRFLNKDTMVYLDTRQLRCIMPLVSGIVEAPADVAAMMKNLEKELLVVRKGHLDTGLHGTYFMTKYLTEHDRSDLIFTYATQRTAPGYGALIAKGYTTWPEQWEGCDSRMHGCFNSIGGWFLRGIAGIRVDESFPGFSHFIIKPSPVGDLTWARGSYHSIRGPVVCYWKRDEAKFTLAVTVPGNSRATVYVPAKDAESLTETGKPTADAPGVKFLRMEAGAAVFEVGSGHYAFQSDGLPNLPKPSGQETPAARSRP